MSGLMYVVVSIWDGFKMDKTISSTIVSSKCDAVVSEGTKKKVCLIILMWDLRIKTGFDNMQHFTGVYNILWTGIKVIFYGNRNSIYTN